MPVYYFWQETAHPRHNSMGNVKTPLAYILTLLIFASAA